MSIHLFCLPRKKSLNLQVEIILGIISIITRSSLLNCLNCSIFWNQHLSDFPGLLSWLSFHIWFFFQYNLVCFNFVLAKNSQKNWFDVVLWPNCFVRGSLIGILLCVIHCTPKGGRLCHWKIGFLSLTLGIIDSLCLHLHVTPGPPS